MGETTAIEWTQATWNPWIGCQKVSQGCKHCYMFRDAERFGKDPSAIRQTAPATFNAPLKWKEPRRIFTCSWSDFFIAAADEWRDAAWEIIRQTPHHTYQILTKRPERILDHLPADWGQGYPNVWLGVTVENQAAADERIPLLLQTPAAVRFLSCEPLLGPVDLSKWLPRGRYYLAQCPKCGFTASSERFDFNSFGDDGEVVCPKCHHAEPDEVEGLHWVIVGGESGPNARPMHPDWARSLRDQCQAAGVAYFFKQWGEHIVPEDGAEACRVCGCTWNNACDGGCAWAERGLCTSCVGKAEPHGDRPVKFRRVGKKAAGRELDGRTWDQFPVEVR